MDFWRVSMEEKFGSKGTYIRGTRSGIKVSYSMALADTTG